MEKLNLSNERIEITVLRNFIFNEAFTRKALPFCKEDYFTNRNERLLFREIDILETSIKIYLQEKLYYRTWPKKRH